MTHYPGLEDYTPPSVGDRVINAGETSLSVENYGRLRDNFAGSITSRARCTSWKWNAMYTYKMSGSTSRLAPPDVEPMRFYPVTIIRPHSWGRQFISRPLKPENGLLESKVCRRIAASDMTQMPAIVPSLVGTRHRPRDVIKFHRSLGHSGKRSQASDSPNK